MALDEENLGDTSDDTSVDDHVSALLTHQALADHTSPIIIPVVPTAFNTEHVQNRLGIDRQFLGELIGVARSEIPVIIAQAALELDAMLAAMQTATECGEHYLRTLHRLQENTETLSIEAMTAILPEGRALVVPVAMNRHHLEEARRHVIDTLNQELANFTAAATAAGFPEPAEL